MEAREIESLAMLARGFVDLKDANPELAYKVILDILAGINEYDETFISLLFPILTKPFLPPSLNRNQAVRQHISTQRGLFPHKRILRKSVMTAKGVIVTEEEESSSSSGHGHGLPPSSMNSSAAQHVGSRATEGSPVTPSVPSNHSSSSSSNPRKSPIAELLYMRWLDGLKMKWPSIL